MSRNKRSPKKGMHTTVTNDAEEKRKTCITPEGKTTMLPETGRVYLFKTRKEELSHYMQR